jgi:Ser/Thr protein kinase RdoA (MazF antagonist)
MPPAGVDIATLRLLFAAHDLAAPLALEELTGGGNGSFCVELADGSAVVLKTYDAVQGKLPRPEAYAAGLVAHLGLPTTRYLAFDDSRTFVPFPVAVTNYLPGVPVSELRDTPHAPDLYRQMGALLRQLHTVRLGGFGHFSEAGIREPVATNAEYMRKVVSNGFARLRHYGAGAALADRLEAIVADRADLFGASNGAVFAHDDLHINNVLAAATEGGYRLSGVIDFGNARAADAVFDLAKTLFMGDHDAPGSALFIREGYGPVDHPDPEAALWLYALVHRVTMWSWLRHIGVIAAGEGLDLIPALQAMADEA